MKKEETMPKTMTATAAASSRANRRRSTRQSFDVDAAVKAVAKHTDEVLDLVRAVENAPGPSEETLRTRISV